jgi:hypothetical protein
MQTQNYKNHRKLAPRAYYVALCMALMVLASSLIYRQELPDAWGGHLLSFLLFCISAGVIFIGYFSRAFALKAQDRAIRAEENLRHFVLSSKLLDSRLTISQIIALRFATDEEFVSLCEKAAKESLNNKEIKELIINWKADHYRV